MAGAGLATAQEDNFFGKHSAAEPTPDRVEHPVFTLDDQVFPSSLMTSSGLAAVWARENTREAAGTSRKPTPSIACLPTSVTRKASRWAVTS